MFTITTCLTIFSMLRMNRLNNWCYIITLPRVFYTKDVMETFIVKYL